MKAVRDCIISTLMEDKQQVAAEGRQPAGAAGVHVAAEGRQPAGAAGVHVAAEVGSRCLLGAGTAAWGRMEGHRLVWGGRRGCWGPVAVYRVQR